MIPKILNGERVIPDLPVDVINKKYPELSTNQIISLAENGGIVDSIDYYELDCLVKLNDGSSQFFHLDDLVKI